ncbi:MAG: class II aldolase/adducin family protein [Desulfosalsimonadaceae bacterium]|nr:class II aldolase/adducin family protein [Desulfosalsimonadaceae bacterium]
MGLYDEYKTRVLKCAKWLSENGYFGCRLCSGGNVSLKIQDADLIIITPTNKPYHDMTIADLCVVDLNLKQVEGCLLPSIEMGMHAAVYDQRPEISGVIHTHQVFASIFSVIGQPIPALFDEVTLALGEITDIVPYALSGTDELANNVSSKLGNQCHSYILQNHGALVLGTDLEIALKNTELLEKSAKVYYYALTTGKPVTFTPQSSIDHFKQLRSPK